MIEAVACVLGVALARLVGGAWRWRRWERGGCSW